MFNCFFHRVLVTATRMFPGTVAVNSRTKMNATQQTLPRSRHKFPAPAPPQVPKGGGRSPTSSSITTTTATPSPVSRFSRVPHWPTEAVPKRVKKLSWDDRNSCAHMTVCNAIINSLSRVYIFNCSNFTAQMNYLNKLVSLNLIL